MYSNEEELCFTDSQVKDPELGCSLVDGIYIQNPLMSPMRQCMIVKLIIF